MSAITLLLIIIIGLILYINFCYFNFGIGIYIIDNYYDDGPTESEHVRFYLTKGMAKSLENEPISTISITFFFSWFLFGLNIVLSIGILFKKLANGLIDYLNYLGDKYNVEE